MTAIIIIYLFVINLIAFVLYGVDKNRAKHSQWRISEKALLGIALIGGSFGAFVGMNLFRHKTKHWYFKYGVPTLLLIHVALIWIVYTRS